MANPYRKPLLIFLPTGTFTLQDTPSFPRRDNDKLSDLRRDLHHEVKDILQKQVLKGTRWLLLKNPENLNTDREEPRRLEEALELNQPLATACYMKEALRQL